MKKVRKIKESSKRNNLIKKRKNNDSKNIIQFCLNGIKNFQNDKENDKDKFKENEIKKSKEISKEKFNEDSKNSKESDSKNEKESDKENDKENEKNLCKEEDENFTKKTNKNKVIEKKIYSKQITLDFFGINIPKANNEILFPNLEKNKKLKIISWNINGIRAVLSKGSLQGLIENEDPDILCLNETKIDEMSLKNEKIEYLFNKKYLTYWNCSKIKKGYSGVAIFTKYKPLQIEYDIKIPKHDLEGRVLYIKFDDLIILSVYTPNSGLTREEYRTKEWDIDFRNFVTNLKEKNNNLKMIITGDMNVCHKDIDIYDYQKIGDNPPFSTEERENFAKLLEVGFIDSFRKINGNEIAYSWFENFYKKVQNIGIRIDYFLVSQNGEDKIINSSIMTHINGSDHVPILLEYLY